jgi:hypothetical protein
VVPAGTDFERHIAIGYVAVSRKSTQNRGAKNARRGERLTGAKEPNAIYF